MFQQFIKILLNWSQQFMVLATSAPDKCMYVGYVSLDVPDFLDFMVAVFLVTSVLQLTQEKSVMFSLFGFFYVIRTGMTTFKFFTC